MLLYGIFNFESGAENGLDGMHERFKGGLDDHPFMTKISSRVARISETLGAG